MSAVPESFLGAAANDADAQETREWLDALSAVLIPALNWICSKIADSAVQIAIGAIIATLAAMYGRAIPGL